MGSRRRLGEEPERLPERCPLRRLGLRLLRPRFPAWELDTGLSDMVGMILGLGGAPSGVTALFHAMEPLADPRRLRASQQRGTRKARGQNPTEIHSFRSTPILQNHPSKWHGCGSSMALVPRARRTSPPGMSRSTRHPNMDMPSPTAHGTRCRQGKGNSVKLGETVHGKRVRPPSKRAYDTTIARRSLNYFSFPPQVTECPGTQRPPEITRFSPSRLPLQDRNFPVAQCPGRAQIVRTPFPAGTAGSSP